MTSDEAALLAAVAAAPDDDFPRLVYADWLDDHGRADRAELIRVQCQAERLHARERELLDRHSHEWGQELAARGADWWRFHRGFPEEVGMPLASYLQGHTRMNKVTPLCHLHLRDATDPDVRRLADTPALAQARSLELGRPTAAGGWRQGEYGRQGVLALAASTQLADLRRLTLHSHPLTEADALRLGQSPALANLTHLTLTAPQFAQDRTPFVFGLAGSPHLGKLMHLQLGDVVYAPHALQSIRRAGRPPGPATRQPG